MLLQSLGNESLLDEHMLDQCADANAFYCYSSGYKPGCKLMVISMLPSYIAIPALC